VVQPPLQPAFPAPDTGEKKFNSRLVAPIELLKRLDAIYGIEP
jgi:hypothetical protein